MEAQSITVNQLPNLFDDFDQRLANYNKREQLKANFWDVAGSIDYQGQPRLAHFVKTVNEAFERLERKGVKVFDPAAPNLFAEAEAYRARFQPYFQLADYVKTRVDQLQKIDPELREACHQLRCLDVSLRYRLGQSNGGLDPLQEPHPDCLAKLIHYTKEWKLQQKQAIHQDINPLEMDQLRRAACYPEWVDLLDHKGYRKEFMGWAIQHYNPVDVFIQYEHKRKEIKASLLSSALGYSRDPSNETLAIESIATQIAGLAKKVLTIPLYHGSFKEFETGRQTRVNILKPEKEIYFQQGNYRLTVKEFFEMCALKDKQEVNVNLSAWGFVNFHPVHGPWNADTKTYDAAPCEEWKQEDWVQHVPPGRIVTQEELEQQYGDEVKNKTFFFKVMGSRKHLDLNALDCHGFWQLYLSMGNGQWKVLNVGAYAYRFPTGMLDGLMLFCATVKRVLCLMDQNSYYTHRVRAGYPIFPEEKEGRQLLDRIFDIMTRAGVFQFSGRNCAYCVQQTVHKEIGGLPNFYKVPVSIIKTGIGPLDSLLAWTHQQADWVRQLVITILHKLLGSGRGLYIAKPAESGQAQAEVWHSVNDFLGSKGHFIYNPAFLVHQIAEAKKTGTGPFVKGEISWTHTDERLLKSNHSPEALNVQPDPEGKERQDLTVPDPFIDLPGYEVLLGASH